MFHSVVVDELLPSLQGVPLTPGALLPQTALAFLVHADQMHVQQSLVEKLPLLDSWTPINWAQHSLWVVNLDQGDKIAFMHYLHYLELKCY